jgi:hypothetical protein
MITCTDPDCHFCHTPQDWSGPIKTTPVKMVTGAELAEALGVMPPGAFKEVFHMSTGEGAGPDSLGEQRPRMKKEHPEKIEAAQLTEKVVAEYKSEGTVRVVDLTDEQTRALHADGMREVRGWDARQTLTWVETGCFKCVEGVDERDPNFRCLEHREPGGQRRWEHRPNGIEHFNSAPVTLVQITEGIAALELPDPQDSIEAKHQRAARRWGAVKASYRRQ